MKYDSFTVNNNDTTISYLESVKVLKEKNDMLDNELESYRREVVNQKLQMDNLYKQAALDSLMLKADLLSAANDSAGESKLKVTVDTLEAYKQN